MPPVWWCTCACYWVGATYATPSLLNRWRHGWARFPYPSITPATMVVAVPAGSSWIPLHSHRQLLLGLDSRLLAILSGGLHVGTPYACILSIMMVNSLHQVIGLGWINQSSNSLSNHQPNIFHPLPRCTVCFTLDVVTWSCLLHTKYV